MLQKDISPTHLANFAGIDLKSIKFMAPIHVQNGDLTYGLYSKTLRETSAFTPAVYGNFKVYCSKIVDRSKVKYQNIGMLSLLGTTSTDLMFMAVKNITFPVYRLKFGKKLFILVGHIAVEICGKWYIGRGYNGPEDLERYITNLSPCDAYSTLEYA